MYDLQKARCVAVAGMIIGKGELLWALFCSIMIETLNINHD